MKVGESEAVQRCDGGEESVCPLSSRAVGGQHTVLRRAGSPHLGAISLLALLRSCRAAVSLHSSLDFGEMTSKFSMNSSGGTWFKKNY